MFATLPSSGLASRPVLTASGVALLHLGLLSLLALQVPARLEPAEVVPVHLVNLANAQTAANSAAATDPAPQPVPSQRPAPKAAQPAAATAKHTPAPPKSVTRPTKKAEPESVKPQPDRSKPAQQPAKPALEQPQQPAGEHPSARSDSAEPPRSIKADGKPALATKGPAQPDADDSPAIELPSTRASYLNNPRPPYPASSKRLGETGTVLLRVLVDANGSAERVAVKKSSGFDALDNSALETVQRWRFVPGKRKGIPTAMEYTVPVAFRLD